MILASVQLDQTDRRLLITAIIVLAILFIVFALIGALIRIITLTFGKRLDNLVSDAVRFRVIENKKQFKKYAFKKNGRKFVKDATPGVCIILVSVIFYVIYGAITNEWTDKYLTEFSTIFWKWDFGNQDNYVTLWGMKLLNKWPELINSPHLVAEYWPSYILSTLWIVGWSYVLIAAWAYFSRAIYVSKRANDIYNKSLEGFNYYDTMPIGELNPNEIQKAKEKSEPNQQ